MDVSLRVSSGLHCIASNSLGKTTEFDAHADSGGTDAAPTPMEVLLMSVLGCTAMDVISILQKKRRSVADVRISAHAERAETHPRIFTEVHLSYTIISNDATIADAERAITLSQEQYCSASAILKRSGCAVTWTAEILPETMS